MSLGLTMCFVALGILFLVAVSFSAFVYCITHGDEPIAEAKEKLIKETV